MCTPHVQDYKHSNAKHVHRVSGLPQVFEFLMDVRRRFHLHTCKLTPTYFGGVEIRPL